MFKAINPNNKNRICCFTFIKKRANQKWEFSTRIAKGGLIKMTDRLETAAFLVGIFNFLILTLTSGLKIATVGPSFFRMMGYANVVNDYLKSK